MLQPPPFERCFQHPDDSQSSSLIPTGFSQANIRLHGEPGRSRELSTPLVAGNIPADSISPVLLSRARSSVILASSFSSRPLANESDSISFRYMIAGFKVHQWVYSSRVFTQSPFQAANCLKKVVPVLFRNGT